MKYIDADKLLTEIDRRKYEVFPTDDGKIGVCITPNQIQWGWLNALKWMREIVISLQNEHKTKVSIATSSRQAENPTFEEYLRGVFEINNGIENDPDNLVKIHAPELLKLARKQEQSETDMKSPFTGGKVAILSREEEVTFRGEKVKIIRKYYRCVDTGREFTDSKLDNDMMWSAFRAYCEKKGMTSFTDIMLKQEQSETDLAEEREIIWHNAIEEVPTNYGAEVLVACRNKNKEDGIWLYDLIQCWNGKWEPRVNWETPVRWAYIEDVDNARKED